MFDKRITVCHIRVWSTGKISVYIYFNGDVPRIDNMVKEFWNWKDYFRHPYADTFVMHYRMKVTR